MANRGRRAHRGRAANAAHSFLVPGTAGARAAPAQGRANACLRGEHTCGALALPSADVGRLVLRADGLRAVYDRLHGAAVVTIMGAVAAELQTIGHRPNFFYLQHGMGLASSIGLGIALSRPELPVVVFDGDGSV